VIAGRLSAAWRWAADRPGFLASTAVAVVFLGFAISVDFPRASHGFKGDEATYYSLTYSLAKDWDFAFQRRDLVRVWAEFPGPEGIFLKRGSKIDVQGSSSFPFIRLERSPDPSRARLFYGKSYIYPLIASPFVGLFGTNGFLIFHALLLALNFAAAYAFLTARGSTPVAAASFAAVFIFASVVPVYFVWLTPELFNVTLVMSAYFLWTYRLAAADTPPSDTRFDRFLRSSRAEYAAAALLGIATFSKPTHALLFLPLLACSLWKRRFRSAVVTCLCFGLVVTALVVINGVTTGEFNYQGGFRKTFYARTGFPFANPVETFDNRGQGMSTNAVPFDILFHRDTATVLAWNVVYFLVGRYSGLLPYFFPGVLAAVLFLWARRTQQTWQWFIAVGLACGAGALLCYMPYTYSGGGGPVGNRYFVSFYPLFLFLLPPVRSAGPSLAALAIGALFVAKVVLNPFYSSFNPGEHAKAGPLRLLPIELTLLNDLPVSADVDRARRTLAGAPPIAAYFPDDGAYAPEGDRFWVKGGSRADVILRAPTWQSPDNRIVPLRIRAFTVEVTSGPPNHVVISAGSRARLDLAAGEVRVVQVDAGSGVPYKPADFPTNYVYALSISTSAGVVPFLEDPASSDSRYLGVAVRIVPIYFNP
jgi:hypothetical protein